MRLLLLLIALAQVPPAWSSDDGTGDGLTRRIEAIRCDMGARRIAVAFRDHQTGRRYALRHGEMFSAASMIKVAVMVAVHGGVQRGRFSMETPVRVTNRFPSTGAGSISRATELDRDVHDAIGATLTVGQLTEAMVARSSNLATNVLLEMIGLEEARRSFGAGGIPGIELGSGMGRGRRSGGNRVSAGGLEQLLSSLHQGEVISPRASQQMLASLFAQRIGNGIPAGLPASVRRAARIAHKTGNIPTAEHDAGLIYLLGREPYALAILTDWPGRSDNHPQCLVRVTQAVHEELMDASSR